MEIIQDIGSYAGLAAVVGLAVLAGLYFSQARDLKRLREWAGRAPERVANPYHPPQRVVAQPMQPPAPPRPPTPPGAPPGATAPGPAAPAQAATAGAGPAVATGPVAATPAAARVAEGSPAADAVTQNTVAHPPPRPPSQGLPLRPAPPGLGGHFAREAQIARAREESEHAGAGTAEGTEGEDDRALVGEDEPPDHEPLEAAGTEGEHPEGEELEGVDDDLDHEHAELDHDDAELDRHDAELDHDELDDDRHDADLEEDAEYAGASVDDLPDPEDFHEGQALVEEPGPPETGEHPAAAPPAPPRPPPPITASRQQPLPPRPPPPPRPVAQGSILPPYEQSRPGGEAWETRKMSNAKAALAVGGTVVVVGAAAFGVLQLTGGGDEDTPEKTSEPASSAKKPAAKKPGAPAVDPRTVTVSVLNGTTVGGLAAKLGDRLEAQGFQLGNVTNNTDQQRAESVVLFATGAEEEAEAVGRRLKIDQREPIDPDSQTRAGDATVVVVAGADLD